MENKKNYVRFAVGVCVVALGLWFYLHQGVPEQGQGNHTVKVGVVTLLPQDVRLVRELPGRVQAHQVAQVRPQVSGIILKQTFEEGSLVKAGQQLYQIDPATFQASYDSALAGLEKANAAYKTNGAKAKRYKALLRIGGVSLQEYDDAVAMSLQSKADVAVAKASVASAKINLDYTKMHAPITGRIGRSFVTQGALVNANQGDAVAVIQALERVYVDVNASLPDMALLRAKGSDGATARQATLILDGAGETYAHKGRVAFDDVSVNPGTGTVVMRVHFPNPDTQLLPGMFVRTRLEGPVQKNVLLVPQKTVNRNADGSTQVWCVGEGDKVRPQKIVLGQEVGTNWIVTSGLQAGDRVVVEGIPKMQPDMVVSVVPEVSQGSSQGQPNQTSGA